MAKKSTEGYKAIDAFNKQLTKAYRQFGEQSAIYQHLLSTAKGVEMRINNTLNKALTTGAVSAKTGIYQISKAKNVQAVFSAHKVFREKLRSAKKVAEYAKQVKKYEKLRNNFKLQSTNIPAPGAPINTNIPTPGTPINTKIPTFDEITAYIFANKDSIYNLMGADDAAQAMAEARAGNFTQETFNKVVSVMNELEDVADETINYFRGM